MAADGTGNEIKFELIKLLLWIGPLSLDRALPGRLETIVGRHTGQVWRSLKLCFKFLPFLEKHLWILISFSNAVEMTSVHSHIGFYQWFQFYLADSGDFNASQAAVCWIRPMLGFQLRVPLIQSLTLATGKLKKNKKTVCFSVSCWKMEKANKEGSKIKITSLEFIFIYSFSYFLSFLSSHSDPTPHLLRACYYYCYYCV